MRAPCAPRSNYSIKWRVVSQPSVGFAEVIKHVHGAIVTLALQHNAGRTIHFRTHPHAAQAPSTRLPTLRVSGECTCMGCVHNLPRDKDCGLAVRQYASPSSRSPTMNQSTQHNHVA